MSTCHITLEQLQLLAAGSERLEEAAEDFLAERRIPLVSHARSVIIQQAWQAGWIPAGLRKA